MLEKKVDLIDMDNPNILLIVLDAVRASDLSVYGYDRETTPYLSKISSHCVKYNNAISSSYWTMPSIASLFTGTYASRHSLVYDGDMLPGDFTTLAEFLRKNEYTTVGLSPHPYVSRYTGLDRGFEVFQDFMDTKGITHYLSEQLKNLFKKTQHNMAFKKIFWYLTMFSDQHASKTNEYFYSLMNKIDIDNPFFFYIHYNEAHTPYILPKYYRDYFLKKNIHKKPWLVNQDHVKYYNGEIKMDKKDFMTLRAIYNGAIRYLDYLIFELLIFLMKRRLFDNTMIIITSDHGDQFGEHGLFFHVFSLYDQLIKIPILIKYPKKMGKYGIKNEIVQNVDLFPTIIDLIDVDDEETLAQFQGNSLLSNRIRNRNECYAISELIKPYGPSIEKYRNRLKIYDRTLMSIRTKNYKYMQKSDSMNEFYDLNNDPYEKLNLYNTNIKEIEMLRYMLSEWIKQNVYQGV